MKNKKIFKLLIVSLLFIISSCKGVYDENNMPHLDGVVFEHLSSFTCNGVNYSISLPKEDESFYLYKHSNYNSSSKVWTLNYDYKIQFILDDYLQYNEVLFNEIYSHLNDNISAINELLNDSVVLYEYNELVTFEETLINDLNGEVSFMYYDKFLPIKMVNLDEQYSYNISIPIDVTLVGIVILVNDVHE